MISWTKPTSVWPLTWLAASLVEPSSSIEAAAGLESGELGWEAVGNHPWFQRFHRWVIQGDI